MKPSEAQRVLGVTGSPPTAAAVDAAFRRSAKLHHPDVQVSPGARAEAADQLRELLEARRVLREAARGSGGTGGRPLAPRNPLAGRAMPAARLRLSDRSLVALGGWGMAAWAACALFSPAWLLLPLAVAAAAARRRGRWSREAMAAAARAVGWGLAAAGIARPSPWWRRACCSRKEARAIARTS